MQILKNILIALVNSSKTYKGAPSSIDTSSLPNWDELNIARGVYFPEREPINYTVRNQNGSGSCVAQTVAKMLEVWDYQNDKEATVYSATSIYQNRSNRPQGGMIGVEALDLPIKNGIYLESDLPSQMLSDSQMDVIIIDPTQKQKIKPTQRIVIPVDFYKVAQQIQDHSCVMVWFKCGMSEWQQDIPTGLSNSEAVRHSVTAVDTITWKGVEYIIIEDSWGNWYKQSDLPLKSGQRAITKEFFDKHCYFAGAFTEFKYKEDPNFKAKFETILVFGDKGKEVETLQRALQADGIFPANQTITGYYGDITRRAVFDFQIRYKVAPLDELNTLRGRRVGGKTLQKLNELYNK